MFDICLGAWRGKELLKLLFLESTSIPCSVADFRLLFFFFFSNLYQQSVRLTDFCLSCPPFTEKRMQLKARAGFLAALGPVQIVILFLCLSERGRESREREALS